MTRYAWIAPYKYGGAVAPRGRDQGEGSGDLTDAAPPDVYAQGAAFYVACLKAGFYDEAAEFAEWFLDTFDIDLET